MPKAMTFLLSLLLMVLAALSASRADEAAVRLGFVKGYSWGYDSRRGAYESPAAEQSMQAMAATGVDCACICFSTFMPTHQTPEFVWGEANPRMVSDDEIRRAIDLARDNKMKVILKPMINCRDGTWRAWVKFFRPVTDEERARGVTGEMDPWGDDPVMREGMVKDLAKWDQWWDNYSAFILHYARIAHEKHVEGLCLGCEMSSTEEFDERWRQLIKEVRDVYDGSLTYDVNHGREDEVPWWDAVDFISVSAYYAVPPPEGQSVEEAARQTTPLAEIAKELTTVKQRLAAISAKWHKPICFIETGCANIRGCARYPWSHPRDPHEHPTDDQEQANYYQAMFEVFYNERWFMGFAWWDWPARLREPDDPWAKRGFCAHGKPAEDVMRQWYAKPRAIASAP
jgi:hypothetical protein